MAQEKQFDFRKTNTGVMRQVTAYHPQKAAMEKLGEQTSLTVSQATIQRQDSQIR